MAEIELHRDLMIELIQTLQAHFADQKVHVSGNLLVFHKEGDKRQHVSPDVFVVRGVDKHQRDNYLIWKEGKGPEMVIELTSASTRDEDIEDKYNLYLELRVLEYFLFDPRAEYLNPPLQGYRLRGSRYASIRPVKGRLPSNVLGLHLERDSQRLRFYDPSAERWLPTPKELLSQAEAGRQEAQAARLNAEVIQQHEREGRLRAEAEVERLRRELEASGRKGSTNRKEPPSP
jgi:hypothetical protein